MGAITYSSNSQAFFTLYTWRMWPNPSFPQDTVALCALDAELLLLFEKYYSVTYWNIFSLMELSNSNCPSYDCVYTVLMPTLSYVKEATEYSISL
jgi:hypothetical protein